MYKTVCIYVWMYVCMYAVCQRSLVDSSSSSSQAHRRVFLDLEGGLKGGCFFSVGYFWHLARPAGFSKVTYQSFNLPTFLVMYQTWLLRLKSRSRSDSADPVSACHFFILLFSSGTQNHGCSKAEFYFVLKYSHQTQYLFRISV